MPNTPILDYMVDTCLSILQDKMRLLTAALALQGKVKRGAGYDPLTGALTQLAIVSRKMNLLEIDMDTWKAAINEADDRWWEWFDNWRPRGLEVPYSAMNDTPRRDEREVIRERLRKLAYSMPISAEYLAARERITEPQERVGV